MPYDAFISYSHAADRDLAAAIQRGLERLGRAPYQPRALHVFRDDTSLTVSPELWGAIAKELAGSSWFVVLCCPEAAASKWVNREIEHWLSTKSAQQILLVATDGEIVWAATREDFDRSSSAVPPALFGAFPSEPRNLEMQWTRDDEHLDLRNARFRGAIAELAAPIHGVPREQLESEDLRRQRHALRLARGAIAALSVLLIVALIAGFVAVRQRGEAQRSARAANARSLAAESTNQLRDAHTGTALLLGAEAARLDNTPATRRSLLAAITDEPSLQRVFATGSDGVDNAAFSSNGKMLAATTSDNRVVSWNTTSGDVLMDIRIDKPESIGRVAFLDHDTLLAVERFDSTPGAGNSVEIWNLRTHSLVRRIATNEPWAVSADTAVLAFVRGKDIRVLNATDGRTVETLPFAGADFLPALALSPDGTYLASARVAEVGTSDRYAETVEVWDVTDGSGVAACDIDAGARFNGFFAQPPDAPILLELAVDNGASVVRTALSGGTRAVLGRCDLLDSVSPDVRTVAVPTDERAPVAAVTPDLATIATRGTFDGAVRLFDTAGKELASPVRATPVSPGNPATVQFSPDGRFFVAADAAGGDVKLWDVRGARPTLASAVDRPSATAVVGTGPDAQVLAVQTGENVTRFVDRGSGATLGEATGSVSALAFTPDGRAVAVVTGGTTETQSLAVLDLDAHTHREIALTGTPCAKEVDTVALASDPNRVFLICDADLAATGNVTVLDISGSDPGVVATTKYALGGLPTKIAVSPDGRFVVVGGFVHYGGGFGLYEVTGGSLRSRKSEPVTWGLMAAAFAPDSRTFATAFGDGRSQLWRIEPNDVASTELTNPGAGQRAAMAFSPDGAELAMAGCDGASDVWSVRPVTPIGTVSGPASSPGCTNRIAFADEARLLLTVSLPDVADRAIVANEWDLDTRNWVKAACSIVGRNLTTKEWSQFLPNVSYHKTCPSEPK